jgi:hypothetical protein
MKFRKRESALSTHHEKDGNLVINKAGQDERRPLRLLEIVLVKRTSGAMVLGGLLDQIHVLKTIPVRGTLRICLDLNGKKSIWATKRNEVWEDWISNTEPDGAKLLHCRYITTPILMPNEAGQPCHSISFFR